MILTQHGINSLPVGGDDYSVTIGGRDYPVVKIGNQLWLAENLDWKFSGLIVGASGTSYSELRGNYYNNDEPTYGSAGNRYGILYNWPAVNYLATNSMLPPEWRVPTIQDYDVLATAVGGNSVAGTKLKSSTGWSSGAGTDDYGFSARPAGDVAYGSFNFVGTKAFFWTITGDSGNYAYNKYFENYALMQQSSQRRDFQFSLRLVKDVT